MWNWLIERIWGSPTSSIQSITAPLKALPQTSDGKTTVLYARMQVHLPVDANSQRAEASGARPTETPEPLISAGPDDTVSPKKPEKTKRERTKHRRRTRAHRFSAIFSDMTPREAKLLFCVHRRSLRHLASESPAALRRDLQRFVLSSRGQAVSCDRPAPTLVRVRRWVTEARSLLGESTADIKTRPLKVAR
jgi:hypothetical protein